MYSEKVHELVKPLEILFESEDLVAVNKPHGLLVHRSHIARDVEEFALQILRDQLNIGFLYPLHRLDRKTSGCLLFAKNNTLVPLIQDLFVEGKVSKTYHAILRGWMEAPMRIDYPVKNDKGILKDAVTLYKGLENYEINVPLGKHPTSRYSRVELKPKTGRFHQLRQHMNHLRHPILGDRPHGCSKQNRLWKHKFGLTEMLLWAKELTFTHPLSQDVVEIHSPPSDTWNKVIHILETY